MPILHEVEVMPFDTTQITSKQNGSKPEYGKPCHPLCANAHPPAVAITQETFFSVGENICPTLKQRDYKDPTAVVSEGDYMVKRVRRLTPTECERLQGWPDGYTDVSVNGKPASDSARYKALGNGMAQPCPRWIIQRIVEVVEDEN